MRFAFVITLLPILAVAQTEPSKCQLRGGACVTKTTCDIGGGTLDTSGLCDDSNRGCCLYPLSLTCNLKGGIGCISTSSCKNRGGSSFGSICPGGTDIMCCLPSGVAGGSTTTSTGSKATDSGTAGTWSKSASYNSSTTVNPIGTISGSVTFTSTSSLSTGLTIGPGQTSSSTSSVPGVAAGLSANPGFAEAIIVGMLGFLAI